MLSVFIAAMSLQQGALLKGLLTDVHSQPGTHRPVRTHEHTHNHTGMKNEKNTGTFILPIQVNTTSKTHTKTQTWI